MRKPTFLDPLLGRNAGSCVLVDADRGSVLATRVEAAFDSKSRNKGLLGRDRIPDDQVLIIAPSNAVHTCFMRFPLDLVFVSRAGTVTKIYRQVRPWRVAWSLRAFAVIECSAGFIDRHRVRPETVVSVREALKDNAPATP